MVVQPITQVMSAHLPKNVPRSEIFKSWIKPIWSAHKHTCWKVVDVESGRIVSVAFYTFDPVGLDKDEPEGAIDLSNDFMLLLRTLWKDWTDFSAEYIDGKPHASELISADMFSRTR
jgi:hypothetical protein